MKPMLQSTIHSKLKKKKKSEKKEEKEKNKTRKNKSPLQNKAEPKCLLSETQILLCVYGIDTVSSHLSNKTAQIFF